MALATAMVPVDLPEEKAAPKPAAKPEDVLYSIMQSVEVRRLQERINAVTCLRSVVEAMIHDS